MPKPLQAACQLAQRASPERFGFDRQDPRRYGYEPIRTPENSRLFGSARQVLGWGAGLKTGKNS